MVEKTIFKALYIILTGDGLIRTRPELLSARKCNMYGNNVIVLEQSFFIFLSVSVKFSTKLVLGKT